MPKRRKGRQSPTPALRCVTITQGEGTTKRHALSALGKDESCVTLIVHGPANFRVQRMQEKGGSKRRKGKKMQQKVSTFSKRVSPSKVHGPSFAYFTFRMFVNPFRQFEFRSVPAVEEFRLDDVGDVAVVLSMAPDAMVGRFGHVGGRSNDLATYGLGPNVVPNLERLLSHQHSRSPCVWIQEARALISAVMPQPWNVILVILVGPFVDIEKSALLMFCDAAVRCYRG